MQIRKKETASKKPAKRRMSLDALIDEGGILTKSGKRTPVPKKNGNKRTPVLRVRTPLIIVKREPTPEEVQDWLSTVPGFIEGLTETDFGATRLYGYQLKYLNRLSSFWHTDKARQCLPEGSVVNTPNGPVPIEKLKSGDVIYSYNFEKKRIELDMVDEAWESGVRNCESILLRSGLKVVAGESHPFLMTNGKYKKNKNLVKGDILKNCRGRFGKNSPHDHEVTILAYLITDGSTVRQPKFTNNDPELVNDFMEAVSDFDPSLEFRVVEKGENALEVFPHGRHGTIEKNSIHTLIEKWGIRFKRKEDKPLPNIVFDWDKPAIQLLLSKMYACDGWYSEEKNRSHGFGFGTSCRKLAYQLQQLLWNFGIVAKVRQTTKAGKGIRFAKVRDFYKVSIGHRKSVLKFAKEIGIYGRPTIDITYKHSYKKNNHIVSIKKKVGKQRCFDISVVKNKNFIFEGLIVHNTGFSYLFAAEGLAKAHLMGKYTKIFISINQEEANEKVTYARAMYDSMPLAWQKKLITDNKKCLEFEGRQGHRTTITRIISHAQREPRGKGGNTEIVLDEAAHYTYGEQIYIAAIPIITRGLGNITVASTPLGKSGIHWELIDNPAHRKIYKYQRVMWWDCRDFVKRGKFKEAKKKAPNLSTSERVDEYGNEKMKAIFISMDPESFQQEYECHHIDESVAFFPLNLINRCAFSTITDDIFIEEDENAEDYKQPPIEKRYPNEKLFCCDNIDDILSAQRTGVIKGSLHGGFDVGRRRHGAEFIISEDTGDGPVITRGHMSFRNTDFEIMEAELGRACDQLNLHSLKIDETGMGIELAENMEKRYPGVCEGVTFTNHWKQENATHVRRLMETQELAIPDNRTVKGQIHSIKRVVSDHGNLRFDAEKNKDHHGDILWAIALSTVDLRMMESGSLEVSSKPDDTRIPKRIIKPSLKRVVTPTAPMMRLIPTSIGVQLNPDKSQ